jgi:hypothetical protein
MGDGAYHPIHGEPGLLGQLLAFCDGLLDCEGLAHHAVQGGDEYGADEQRDDQFNEGEAMV